MRTDIVWVDSYDGQPSKLAPITIFPYRNRISLNTYYGCHLGCAYCICQSDSYSAKAKNRPVRLASAEQILESLNTVRSSLEGYRINIGDFSDPFGDKNLQEDSLKILRGLHKNSYSNPISLTSKVAPSQKFLEQIQKLPLRLSLYVSLSDVGTRVEKMSAEQRVLLAQKSYDAGIHTVLLMRPLHPAWSVPEQFFPVLKLMRGYIDEVVVSGLRATDKVRQSLAKKNILIVAPEDEAFPFIDSVFESEIINVVNKALPGVSVTRTRSCPSNRRYNLACLQPSAQKYPVPEQASRWPECDNWSVVRRDWNGYCRLSSLNRPFTTGLTPEQSAVLEKFSLIADAAPAIPWRLIGGTAQILNGMGGNYNELNVGVDPEGFYETVRRLEDCNRGLRMSLCKAHCLYALRCPEKEFDEFQLLMTGT